MIRLRSEVATPKILRDVIDFVLYGLAALPILQSQLDLNLGGLLATSAVLSVVIGLALQDTLGNLFAGLSLQLERPYQVGDFIRIGETPGRVVQIGWRATRIVTCAARSSPCPTARWPRRSVKNFSFAYEPMAVDHLLRPRYDTPPNQVKERCWRSLKEVPTRPPGAAAACAARWGFEELGIRYQVRYCVADYAARRQHKEELYTRLWYRLRREDIELPHPQRMVNMRKRPRQDEFSPETVRRAAARGGSLLGAQPGGAWTRLRRELVPRRFGKGERVIEEGEEGHTFYLVASGEVSVRTGKGHGGDAAASGAATSVRCRLLTGEPRAATVVAVEDAVLLELDRPAFARLFVSQPGLARQLSALLAQRRTQLRAVAEAGGSGTDPTPEAGRILGRLRQIFGLSAQD